MSGPGTLPRRNSLLDFIHPDEQRNALASAVAGRPLNQMVYEGILEPASTRLNSLAQALGGILPPEPRRNLGAFLGAMVPRPQDIVQGSADLMQGAQDGSMGGILGGLGMMAMGTMDAVPGGKAAGMAVDAAKSAKGIRAYHGSPHDFDRFSLDKIGTGEGAQAYGHGLYFAESEGVAKSYRDQITQNRVAAAKRALEKSGQDIDAAIANTRAEITRLMNLPYGGGDIAKRDRFVSLQEEKLAELAALKNSGEMSKGRMYEVNIKANPENFLDWDKPFSQQSQDVQDALTRAGLAPKETQFYGFRKDGSWGPTRVGKPDPIGIDILGDRTAEASKALLDAGIPGIKYLDAGSRTAGDGSRNYVVFDDATVEILRKYGLAGLYAGAGAGALSELPGILPGEPQL